MGRGGEVHIDQRAELPPPKKKEREKEQAKGKQYNLDKITASDGGKFAGFVQSGSSLERQHR